MSKLKNKIIKKIAWWWITTLPTFLFYFIIMVWVLIPFTFLLLLISWFVSIFNNQWTETSLSYYESDSFYWMPYNAAFKNSEWYESIFKLNKSIIGNDKDTVLDVLNYEIEEKLSDILVKEVPWLAENNLCWDYCDNYLAEVLDVELKINDTYQYDDYRISNIINSDIWKENISYFMIKIKDRINDRDLNIYFYENANGEDIEDSIYRYKNNFWKEVDSLFLKQRSNLKTYDFNKWNYKYTWTTTKYNNINTFINEYFFSQDNFINRIYWNDEDEDVIYVKGMNYIFSWEIKEKAQKILTETIEKDYLTLYDSNIIDMLNFSWIKSVNDRSVSLSNQFLLSQERIDLEFFQKRNFWKDYKNLIFYPSELSEITYDDIKGILNYKEWRKNEKESNEFWFIINNDIWYQSLTDNEQKSIPAINNIPILTDWQFYYSKDYKYPTKSWWECDPLYPQKWSYDEYVKYTTEALYSWQKWRMECKKTSINSKWEKKTIYSYINFNIPPLIQEASVTYYKKFIYSDENKKSVRNKDDYYFNYFYDKSYIQDWSDVQTSVNLINNIYIDRETILFKGIYLKISWFWIEIKDEWKLIVSKKEANSYKDLLPNSPIKIEIWVLTDLNKEIQEVSEFDLHNNPNKNFSPIDKKLYNNGNNTEIKLYNYEKLYNLKNENTILSKLEKSANKYNNTIESLNKIEDLYKFAHWKVLWDNHNSFIDNNIFFIAYEGITWSDNKNQVLRDIFDLRMNELFTNYKNNYFYDSVQKEKLIAILDDLYNINDTNNNITDIFKKHIVLFSDITSCIDWNCSIEWINKSKNENIFNENIINSELDFNIKTFDKCSIYKNLWEVFTEISKVDNNIWIDKWGSSSFISNQLITPCYNTYYPYIEVEIKPNLNILSWVTEQIKDDLFFTSIQESIDNVLWDSKHKVFLTDPWLYAYKNNSNYNVELSPYQSQLFDMFYDDSVFWDNDQDDLIKDWTQIQYQDNTTEKTVQNIFYNNNIDWLEEIWAKYKEQDVYQNNCNEETERHLKWSDNNFACSKKEIYNEFINKLTANKKYYYFIKEEYLKESIQDEEFLSYYNEWILGDCSKYNICENSENISDKASVNKYKFVPLDYNLYKYRLPIYQTSYFSDIVNNHKNLNNVKWNESIIDFSYTLDLNKTFSYSKDDYNLYLDLHTVSINPNIYLHSFISWIKEKENKYVINFFWKWLNWIFSDKNKSTFEKNYINKLNYFLAEKVSWYKLLIDSYYSMNPNDKSKLNKWLKDYDVFHSNYYLSSYISWTTISNNLEDYIDNKSIYKLLWNEYKNINNIDISIYDINIPKWIIDKYYISEWQKTVFEKYLYSISLAQNIKTEQDKIIKDVSNNITSVKIFDFENKTLRYDKKDIMFLKDTLLYNMWYLWSDHKTWTWFSLWNIVSLWSNYFRINTTKELIDEDYKDIYKLSSLYKENEDELKNKIKEISNIDVYNTNYINNMGKTIYNDKWEIVFLNTLQYKKEMVLNMEIYYWDLLDITKKYDETISDDILKNVIDRQLKAIKILKDKKYTSYYKYYLEPVINQEDIISYITDPNFKIEVEDLFTNASNEELFITDYSDYIIYMNIVNNWLPYEINKEDNIILPLKNVINNYEFSPSEDTQPDEIMNAFRTRWDTTYLPTYNFISDLFLKTPSSWDYEIINVNAKKEIEAKLWTLEKKRDWLINIYSKENWVLKNNIWQELLNLEKIMIDNKELLKKYDDNDYFEYKIGINEITGDISITKLWEIILTEDVLIKEEDNINPKNLYFTWPFDWYNSKNWFITSWNKDYYLEYFANSQLNLSFNLNNIRTIEFWLRDIIDELSIYSFDYKNEEVNNLSNYDTIWNFYYIYVNNWYVDANSNENKLKFEIKLKDWRELTDVNSNSTLQQLNIYSLRNQATKNVLDNKFEEMKVSYCKSLSTESDTKLCVDYMDHLKSMTLSEVNAEMEYLTATIETKELNIWNKKDSDWVKYFNLAEKYSKNDLNREILFDYNQNNDWYIWQCTWYAKLLKWWDLANWGHWKHFYSYNKNAWKPTDYFDPRKETPESVMNKMQVWDVISFIWWNNKYSWCNYNWEWAREYWHVAIIKRVNYEAKTVILVEANVDWVMVASENEYNIEKLCAWWLVHWVEWKY